MKKILMLWVALSCTTVASSQNIYKAIVRDAVTNALLPGVSATLIATGNVVLSDSLGTIIFQNVPDGLSVIKISIVGYKLRTDSIKFPYSGVFPTKILLEPETEEVEEVVVSATRSSRTIAHIPTRVEVISGEELDEKSNMKPGDIRMLLSESTGVQTQQTSATSANSSIRIQGLDGKYTQIIRDGFPLYSGFSGGLGLLQIAPLDLQQVEVIKGSASTLYGGGAIAGLVNLVSKRPANERQLSFLLNGTSASGLDASAFYAEKFNRVGATIYAAYNHGSAYDPSGIDLTAIPKYDRLTVNPKVYVALSERTDFNIGANLTVEDRIGGDLHFIKGENDPLHTYFERNETDRFSLQAELTHKLAGAQRLTIRGSSGYYDRTIALPGYQFSGVQRSSYGEINYTAQVKNADWVAGVNFMDDSFKERALTGLALRNYSDQTVGAFAQNTWDVSPVVTVESGLRLDHHDIYGFILLPRLSAMFKLSDKLSSRLGGGLGYKTPNIFTEESERVQFRNILPVDPDTDKPERSLGLNLDMQFNTGLFNNTVALSINQLFFYTRINDPLLLSPVPGGFKYLQPGGDLNTKGIETNLKLVYGDLKLFAGYTFADVTQHSGSIRSRYPLVSKHRLNNVLMYELEDEWKLGAEAYYFGPQLLSDGNRGKSYWITGFLAEKLWERFSLFINFENFTNTRQARFDTVFTGPVSAPVFRDIYAPMDGFVVNGGVKVRL